MTMTDPAADGAPRPRRDLRPLLRLIPHLRPYRLIAGSALLFLLLAAGATLVLPAAVREMIDHGFVAADPAQVDRAFLGLFTVALALAAFTSLRLYFVTWLGERVVTDVRRRLFSHLLALSPAYFERTRTGDLVSRLTADVTLIQDAVSVSISIALRNSLLITGAFALLLVTSPKLTGLVLLAVPLAVVPLVLYVRVVRERSRRAQDRAAYAAAYASEAIAPIQTVQSFTHETHDRAAFDAAQERAFAAASARVKARSTMTFLVIALVFVSIVLLLWIGASAVLAGDMTPGTLSQFVLYAVLLASGVGALSEVFGEMQRAAGAAERIFEVLDEAPAITVPAAPVPLPSRISGRIAFEGVTFRYPLRPEVTALDGITLTIAPGERVAIVGPSGAGKTTLFALLQRFFDPQAGRITVDGIAVSATDPQALRQQIAVVPQDVAIFGTTAIENIRYGRPGATYDEVHRAAAMAAADGFIRALPQGYATQLGERGVTLSGGQRQRIAIARAILRDAPILLLDEATSALDAESEAAVQGALATMMEGRTTLVIAHRLATVRQADRIIVLDRARIVAEGRHDALVQAGGLYARLAALQFKDPGLAAAQ